MAYVDLPSNKLVNFSFRAFESVCGSGCTGGVFVSDLQGHSLETSHDCQSLETVVFKILCAPVCWAVRRG